MEYYDTFSCGLGELILCCNSEQITGLFFSDQKYAEQYRARAAEKGSLPVLEAAKRWLTAYLQGKNPGALPPIAPLGTPFQQCIWSLLLEIPYGETTTYGALAAQAARQLGKERMSAQAVGGAVGRNPIAILIPCHRVIGADGSLTGYAGGIDKKEALLKIEGIL